MPNSHPITLPPPRLAPVLPPPAPPCVSDFQRNLELCIKRQQSQLLDLMAALYGFDICVYNPTFTDSAYDTEDQGFHYPLEPEFQARALVKGLFEYLRYAGTDQYSMPEVTLYWNSPNVHTIKENARIVIHCGENWVTFRAKHFKVQLGIFVAYRQIFTLVPWM